MARFWSRALLFGLLISGNQVLADCWVETASRYDIEPELLQAIAAVESGNRADAINTTNSNGTRDIGLMQINSIHLPACSSRALPRTVC